MASTKSTELSATEIELKRRGRRRLIGAATIGLLGIVFLPMIFDGEPKQNPADSTLKKQQISVQVPAKDGLPLLPAPSAVRSPSTPVPPTPVVVEPIKETPPEVAKVVTETSVGKTPSVAPTAKPEKLAPSAKSQVAIADKTGFAVQLGAFGDAEKAKQAVAMMKDAKLPVYTENIAIKTGTATRVRVGPFPTREKADSALAQIKLAGSDGKIVPLQ